MEPFKKAGEYKHFQKIFKNFQDPGTYYVVYLYIYNICVYIYTPWKSTTILKMVVPFGRW